VPPVGTFSLSTAYQFLHFRCRFFYLICSQFYFKSTPASVFKLNNGINLFIVIILIMEYVRAEGFRVNFQIALHESFKQKSEGFKVAPLLSLKTEAGVLLK